MTDVSVIIETVTVRFDHDHGPLAEAIAPTIAGLELQTFGRDRFETLLVLDDAVDAATIATLRVRYPDVRLVLGVEPNYFAQKNAGAAAARGSAVAFLDADCVPDAGWLQALADTLAEGADLATGGTRYAGESLSARTFSVPDFGTVIDDDGTASGIMLNNVALRRDLALRYPLDGRIPRNGGCYLLYHQLLATGARMTYTPRAVIAHALDVDRLGFVRKHFDRGYDSIVVYRCDETHALRGTRLFQRFGPFALVALTARRVLVDWRRLARTRLQIGVPRLQLPDYAAVLLITRAIELCGGMAAVVVRRRR